ncbi:activated RNA polymerase ii transcriptional coactivator p15 [Anaeramoeba ignava]|uniref:Activated RNA polymerase ii transcriptional coactivator p15 n=1 Tax=Anaeramoeba ignava TaxID=1746090 RepID=A0A9Q0L676_ANAIG|nr:activated RNA polymerase ii transcriptional coactivator p15 [Anaeramoeba ignava]
MSSGINLEETFDLGGNKKIVVSKFRGKVQIEIREFYKSGNEWKRTRKGVNLNGDQFKKLMENKKLIDKEFEKLLEEQQTKKLKTDSNKN